MQLLASASSRKERRTQHVPEGHKRCKLCGNVRAQSHFKLKYDGNHYAYCSTCDKLVGRGRRRGLSMDTIRASFKDGTLQHLLCTHPIVQVGAGPAGGAGEDGGLAASTSTLATSAMGVSSAPRVKNCNLCSKDKAVEHFRIVSGGRIGAYCIECDRLIGRARCRGLKLDEIRAARADDTLAYLGIASKDERGALGTASGAAPDQGGARERRASRGHAGSSSGMFGGEGPGALLQGVSGAGPQASELGASPLHPESCVKCGNTFMPNARGETLCTYVLLHNT